MEAIFDFLNQPWVGSAIAILGIVVGVLIAAYFYWKAERGAQLAYHYKVVRVLGGRDSVLPEAVRITFHDQPIQNLCRSLILVWNSGKKTIEGRNIVDADPLRIDMGDGTQVLDARLIKVSRAVNNCNLMVHLRGEEVQVAITFDYLDEGDGCVFELFHTDSGTRPKLVGSIREMPRGFKNYKQLFPQDQRTRFFPPMFGAVGLYLLGRGFYLLTDGSLKDAIGSLLFGAFLAGTTLPLAILLRRRYPKTLSMPEFTSS